MFSIHGIFRMITQFLFFRCVEEDIKPFALGVGWVLFRLLGKSFVEKKRVSSGYIYIENT